MKLFLKLIFFILPTFGFCQTDNTMSLAKMLVKTSEKFHIDNRIIDSQAAEFIFHTFLTSLDRAGIVFSRGNIDSLSVYKYDLGNLIDNEDPIFLDQTKNYYLQGLNSLKDIMNDITLKEFDIQRDDTLYLDEKYPFLTEEERTNKWSKWLKYLVIKDYFDTIGSVGTHLTINHDNLLVVKDSIVEDERRTIIEVINDKEKIDEKLKIKFLSAIAASFDPHTNFFSIEDKQEFIESISKNKESYGLEIIKNEQGEIEISSIVPGSTAWNSNSFQEGDIILSIKLENGVEKSFKKIQIKKALEILQSEGIDEAIFKIKKQNGEIKTVELLKSTVNVEDNSIDSYILEGENKIGYISLPSFYVNKVTGNGSANDIAKELIQLIKEGIDGLVFDLRNNTGGNMEEAIKLCGMFLNYGALSIVQIRDSALETIKDINKGSVYNGPMVVMINRASASASEFFAAAMQDYNRALIVGSHTYGKASMQTILPLEAYKYSIDEFDKNSNKSNGFVKLTIGKLYRCTGKTYQKLGVMPDISLPDIYSYIDFGEEYGSRALDATIIDKKTYFYPLEAFSVSDLSSKSNDRIFNNVNFKRITEINKVYANSYNQRKIPISFNGYKDYLSQLKNLPLIQNIDSSSALSVKIPDYTLAIGKLPNANLIIRELRMKDIKSDIYIEESYNILLDYMKSKSR